MSVLALVWASSAAAQETDFDPQYGAWGIDLPAMDQTVDPGDNFYRYVSGTWLDREAMPDGYARWSAFEILARKTDGQVNDIVTDLLAGNPPPGSSGQQISDFYRSYLDVDLRNRLGIEPVRDLIDRFMSIKDEADLARAMVLPEATSPIGFGVLADPGHPERQILHVSQSGLTMPDPVYYLGEGDQFGTIRASFLDYAETVFTKAGFSDAKTRAEQLLAIETEIARRQWSAEQSRDRVRMYHLMPVDELADFAPGVDWSVMLASMGASDVKEVNVNTDTAVRDLSALVAGTPLATWRSYLVFHLLDNFGEMLSEDLNAASFAFNSTTLAGIETQRPVNERAIAMLGSFLAEPVGQIYAERYFSAENKQTIKSMIGYLEAEYRERFRTNAWMDDKTRAEALTKLEKIVDQIGYPEEYHDYSSVRIAPGDLVGNVRRLVAWNQADAMKKLKEPTRKWEWPYPVQVINAGYVAALNSVTFPAGILQPPFFHPDGDIAVNFGSIGAVIGHELGHAFDDQGKTYDGTGTLRNWWTDQSEARFRERTNRLVAQFNGYSPIEGSNVNGALTLGENIGDLGGLTVGFAAYRRYVEDQQGGQAPVIDGFTGDQRFFLSWGQLWRSLSTPADIRRRLVADVHSPPEFRVNGAVRNVDGWYEAFGIEPDASLYLAPEQRVHIW